MERRLPCDVAGYRNDMVVLLILILLAAVFGVGAVLEGIAWAFLISLLLLAAAAWAGWRWLSGRS